MRSGGYPQNHRKPRDDADGSWLLIKFRGSEPSPGVLGVHSGQAPGPGHELRGGQDTGRVPEEPRQPRGRRTPARDHPAGRTPADNQARNVAAEPAGAIQVTKFLGDAAAWERPRPCSGITLSDTGGQRDRTPYRPSGR